MLHTPCNQFFDIKLKIHIHMPMRQLSTGRRAIMLSGSGRGYIEVHCPKAFSSDGKLKHSTPHSAMPPATTIFPPMNAAACDCRGFVRGATKAQLPLADGSVSRLEQLNISTVRVDLFVPVWPPMANKRPSLLQTIPKLALFSCIFGNSWDLKIWPEDKWKLPQYNF